MRSRLLIAALVTVLGVAAFLAVRAGTGAGTAAEGATITMAESRLERCAEPTGGPVAADSLPELTLPCLGGGPPVSLAAAPGLPMVLNLWATWCGPCRAELPIFQRLHEQAPGSVRMLGVVQQDTVASVGAYAAEMGLNFPSLLDADGELLTEGGINGLPVTYFVRADGSIAHRQLGPIPSYDALRGLIGEHLGVTVPG
ncbi:hypothetical protein BH20ACT5_BH20ACT5_23500 [soil metagenome]